MQKHPAELTCGWWEQAADDLANGRRLAERSVFHLACFLAQQAAEKAIKAVLLWEHGDWPRTHAIRLLLTELAGVVLDADLARNAETLDKFYVTTRYPDALDYAPPFRSFSQAEADSALGIAQRVVDTVRAYLGERGVFEK
jgi:HEPN domain-containing protein